MARGRGEGTIHQRPDGLWTGQISLGMDAEGRRVRPTIYGKTKREVREKLLALQQDALKGLPVKAERLTFAQHFEDWLRAKKPNIRPSTFGSYSRIYRHHLKPYIGGVQLKALDYRRINALYELLDGNSLSKRTVAYAGYLLRSSLEDALAKGLIQANPAKLAAKRTYRKEEARFLTQDEMRCFLDAAKGERLEDAFILALHTGLRPGEWLGLTWPAVDWENRKITVEHSLHDEAGKAFLGPLKTKAARRTVSLSQAAYAALKRQSRRQKEELLAEGRPGANTLNLVFTDRAGHPLRGTNIARRDLRRVLAAAGLEGVTLHTFRHTHASILIFQGVDIKAISRRLGHENITTTLQIYGHLLPGQDERAAQQMDEYAGSL